MENSNSPQGQRSTLFEQCKDLAEAPDILSELARDLIDSGYVGDIRRPQLTFLTSYTRFEQKPVSLCFKGGSAAGKSTAVEWPLEYIPQAAYHRISGMSEKALQYIKEPLAHKHLVVGEFAGLQSTTGNKWLRQLLSEGRLVYDVVVLDPATGDRVTKTLVTEGPTGVIFTTTEDKLHPEDETRLISIYVDDGPEQNREVIRAQARQSEEATEKPNFDRWHKLHDWISSDQTPVIIPYAEHLSELVDISDDRIKRDYPQVISLIKAHARLHQASRERDESGFIVATLDDYNAVHRLIAEALDTMFEVVVPEQLAEICDAVVSVTDHRPKYEEGVPQFVIQAKLGINSKGYMSKWVNRAEASGYLINIAVLGRPKQLLPGDPLPGSRNVLPSPEELEQAVQAAKGAETK